MIDPNNIINFHRDKYQKEELLLFLVCVAGKKASTVAPNLHRFLYKLGQDTIVNYSPFEILKFKFFPHGDLKVRLKNHGFGCQNRINRAFYELAHSDINLDTCTKEDLMQIHGIGRKSASCFLAWTRKGERVAMLDTHLLKYLRQVQNTGGYVGGFLNGGFLPEESWAKYSNVPVPMSTPTGKLYDTLENFYLDICDFVKVDPTEHDLQVWKFYSNRLDRQAQSDTI